jgi:hypothetical protein
MYSKLDFLSIYSHKRKDWKVHENNKKKFSWQLKRQLESGDVTWPHLGLITHQIILVKHQHRYLCNIRPRLFYLLDYRFLPQNVSEVGRKKQNKKNRHRRPLLWSEDGSLACLVLVWVEPMYNRIDLMEGLNTWRSQDYVSSSKTAEHFNQTRGIADL